MKAEQMAVRSRARTRGSMFGRKTGLRQERVARLALALGVLAALGLLATSMTGTAATVAPATADVQASGTQEQLPDAPQPQNTPAPPAAPAPNIPDAPSATRSTPGAEPDRSDKNVPPPADAAPPAPASPSPTPPQGRITTVPAGTAPDVPGSPRDELFKLTKNVNFVLVPVTVKDTDGRLVQGLVQQDFRIYENGAIQRISFFTSDPFPLSAAVVLDTALPDITWKKVRDTLPALVGAFGQFDEVALFSYGNTVRKVQDFTGIDAERITESLRTLKRESGMTGGVPVVGGPMTGGPSPNINGQPVQPNIPQVPTYPKQSYVLNDAILRAADELSKREPTRRKIVFVISDGREVGSANGYNDVLKVLLSHQISVYAIGMASGVPGYDQLKKIHVPGLGYSDILPKYASATGGQVFGEFNKQAVEEAYSRVTEEARNQYTIGYNTPVRPSSSYRSIEVRVNRPSLKVYARDGYYPLPPGRP